MRPLLLKGHTKPITYLQYNKEGDLLFTCGKDKSPQLWKTENGERIGTYDGHRGAVWGCDVNNDSSLLLTASGDFNVKMWDVMTGEELQGQDMDGVCRSVRWNNAQTKFAVGLKTLEDEQKIVIVNVGKDNVTWKIEQEMEGHEDMISCLLWSKDDKSILSGSWDGTIRHWDVVSGKQLAKVEAHKDKVMDLQYYKDKTMFISGGVDSYARLWDTKTLKLIHEYKADRPVRSAAVSPVMNHVIMGGGQDAKDVTQSAEASGKFESLFYDLIYKEYLGKVSGHFGPIHTLAIAPNGKQYCTGSEDGYIRMCKFDESYFKPEQKTKKAIEKKKK